MKNTTGKRVNAKQSKTKHNKKPKPLTQQSTKAIAPWRINVF